MRVGRGFDIDAALSDPLLLGAALGDTASWRCWIAVLRAAFGLPLDRDQRAIFSSVSDNRPPPTHRVEELWVVAGRRSGKSRMAAAVATFLAVFNKHRLARGEVGHVLVLAASQAQAQTVFGYCEAFLQSSPILRQEIVSTTQSEIRLRNAVVISVHSNSFRSVRGRTLIACVCDEIAYWRDETSALPDTECYRALRPSLLAAAGMLVSISTPYRAGRGLLYSKWHNGFGVDDPDTLVVAGASRKFNPLLSEAAIDRALADDPEGSKSEWSAEFRNDLAAFLDDQLIAAAVDCGRPPELPPLQKHRYAAFADASGGRGNHYCLAIGHKDGERVIIDVVRGSKPPFDPVAVTQKYCELLKDYGIKQCEGDEYAAEWAVAAFRANNIKYVRSERNKSALYAEALPLFTRHQIALPDLPVLVKELRLLERRTHGGGGRDTIDHPRGPGQSDDYANVVAGCAAVLSARPSYRSNLDWVFGANTTDTRTWNQKQLARYIASGGYTAPMFRRF
jgi:hypothetical protein